MPTRQLLQKKFNKNSEEDLSFQGIPKRIEQNKRRYFGNTPSNFSQHEVSKIKINLIRSQ